MKLPSSSSNTVDLDPFKWNGISFLGIRHEYLQFTNFARGHTGYLRIKLLLPSKKAHFP